MDARWLGLVGSASDESLCVCSRGVLPDEVRDHWVGLGNPSMCFGWGVMQ